MHPGTVEIRTRRDRQLRRYLGLKWLEVRFDNFDISVPEQPQPAQADYGSEKELSNKDLRKIGVSWDNVNIESDQELLQFTRGRDIFTLPNPGTVEPTSEPMTHSDHFLSQVSSITTNCQKVAGRQCMPCSAYWPNGINFVT